MNETEEKRPIITLDGKKGLEDELKALKEEERVRIQNARLQAEQSPEGKNSALFRYAMVCESFNESRIATLEKILKTAEIVDTKAVKSTTVVFGSTVVLASPGQDPMVLKMVSVDEASLREGRLSIESKFGKNLLGKSVGAVVRVSTPDGDFDYVIQELKSS